MGVDVSLSRQDPHEEFSHSSATQAAHFSAKPFAPVWAQHTTRGGNWPSFASGSLPLPSCILQCWGFFFQQLFTDACRLNGFSSRHPGIYISKPSFSLGCWTQCAFEGGTVLRCESHTQKHTHTCIMDLMGLCKLHRMERRLYGGKTWKTAHCVTLLSVTPAAASAGCICVLLYSCVLVSLPFF